MKYHMKKLGFAVRDSVTGFEGIVTSIGFDLYGCVQCIVTPVSTTEKDGKQTFEDSRWFDEKRLIVTGKKPVMALPNFDEPVIGGQEKPRQSNIVR